MIFTDKGAEGVKIAYVGGGSRGWAWGLMSDLVSCPDMSGEVRLYDIDHEAAKTNEIIGNLFNNAEGAISHWTYHAKETLGEALDGADFVVISILPGTFDEMESDVHTPEEYGIYQPVGDTIGLGGILRTLRTAPMMEVIGKAIKENCPYAWVINYTNPMTMCIKTLYRVFPQIKAFGCCHEVFGTQWLLACVLKDMCGVEGIKRPDVEVNVVGVNHFTWLTSAKYKQYDLFDIYPKFVEKYHATGFSEGKDNNWMNNVFASMQRIKLDLFKRYGYIAAAGDRHLVEFCPSSWYLKDKETVREWKYGLTPVSFRKDQLKDRYKDSDDYISGAKQIQLRKTGEDGVNQMRSLLGLTQMTTNVNLPNVGQIPNLPLGAVVETNAVFRNNSVTPVNAGNIPSSIYSLIARIVGEYEALNEAVAERSLDKAFAVFMSDPQMNLSIEKGRELFDKMVNNTKKYLTEYFK